MDTQYIFLSYSHENKDVACKIQQKLMHEGIPCWIDQYGIRTAENYNAAIDKAIDGCSIFLAMLSKSYIEKYYCEHEFNRAIDVQKCIVSVCLDDVDEKTNRQKAYMFSFSAGYNILRYGTGIDCSDEDISKFCENIISSIPVQQLLRANSGDPSATLPIQPSDYLLAHLRMYNEKQYQQSGNYALSELCSALFPTIKDVDLDIDYKDENEESVSLIKYLSNSNSMKSHVFLTGEGGMGKTVSLLKTCEYLLSQNRYAIYIPLNLINSELTLDCYIKEYVCSGREWAYMHLCAMMTSPFDKDTSVIFLLDGVNEIAPDGYVDKLFKIELKRKYIDAGKNVRFIISSRFDTRSSYGLTDCFTLLAMQPLDHQKVMSYLSSCGIPHVRDEKVISILKTPLLLSLYANVEKHWEKYRKIEGITLNNNPNTAGKILSNFFQTQLFRAAEEPNFDLADHLVLLEYLLPNIAFKMVSINQFYLEDDDIWECYDGIEDDDIRFTWYKADRLRRILHGKSRFVSDGSGKLLDLAETALHFLHRVDGKYEFLHQTFRDYFAAYHIANEMTALLRKPARIDEIDPIIQAFTLNEDIASFVSDITHEEDACPYLLNDGWVFPGKVNQNASTQSVSEQLLQFWRNKTGKCAQNAVCNLIQVMRIGRSKNLAWCDFSELDLRGCYLNGCKFSEWYSKDIHPCSFNNALLNRDCFITNGHESAITSVCTTEGDVIFSGDKQGVVKILNCATRQWVKSMQLHNSPIVHMAWNEPQKSIAILYENILFVYSMTKERVVYSLGNESRSKKYRYVSFDRDNHVLVSYDLEPLIWYTADGVQLPSSLKYDVPSKCAQWNPQGREIIRSCLLQILSIDVFNQETKNWEQHPALISKRDILNKERKKMGEKPLLKVYLSLREFGISGANSVNCICYRRDGKRFLVSIENCIMEFDCMTLCLIQKKTFSSKVHCVCYGNNCIVAGVSSQVVIMGQDLTEQFTMFGTKTNTIGSIVSSPDGQGYYLVTGDGEIKLLDQTLTVRRIRRCKNKKRFAWVRDRKTNELQMMFLPTPNFTNGSRYSFERDRIEPLGWCFEFLDSQTEETDDQRIYKFDTSIMAISTQPPYNKIEYTNYGGIWIFGCSFLGIQGDLSDRKCRHLLKQNGGIISEQ